MNCLDCANPIEWVDLDTKMGEHAKDEHPGLCCDCFEEHLGHPDYSRDRPRSCFFYGCSAGHLATKNDDRWSGPCDVGGCRERPAYLPPDKSADIRAAYATDPEKATKVYADRVSSVQPSDGSAVSVQGLDK